MRRWQTIVALGHDQPHDERDQDQGAGHPEPVPLPDEQGGAEDADQDQRDAAAAVVEAERRPRCALLGKQDPAGGVDDEPGPAEERQHDEGDPQDHRVDVEVSGQPAGDAGDLAVGDGPAQPAEVADLGR